MTLEGADSDVPRSQAFESNAFGDPLNWSPTLRTIVELLQASKISMFVAWGAEHSLFYNNAFAEASGIKHPATLHAPASRAWPEAWPALEPLFALAYSGAAQFKRGLLAPQNRIGKVQVVEFDLALSPIVENGSVRGLWGVLVETTQRSAELHELNLERERLARLFHQAPTFMAMLSGPKHRIDLANPGYLKLVGHRNVIGRTVEEALPDAVAQGYLTLLDDVFSKNVAYAARGAKYAVQALPGGESDERYVDFVYQPIADERGTVVGIFVEGVDVTDRVLAEQRREALALMSAELANLKGSAQTAFASSKILGETLGVSRVGYGTIDHDAETLHVDRDWTAPSIESLAGVTPLRDYGSFIDGLKRDEFIAIDDVRLDERTAIAAEALESRSARAFMNVPVVEDGRLVAVLFVNDADVRHWTTEDRAFMREVASRTRTAVERSRVEEALRSSEAQLRETNSTLEAKVAQRTSELMAAQEALRQSQKMEAIGHLTGGIAHDFNNLLVAISGGLEMVQRRLSEGRDQGVDRYINAAQEGARRAAALTHRLLAFSRRQTLDPHPVNANKLVRGIEDLIRRSVGPNIVVEVVELGGLWITKIDASQLENALLNLCINGRDAMAPGGGRLTIETANKWLDERGAIERQLPPGQYISICVTDTGSGMSADVIERAFDPFFTTKPIGTGTGLGLSMVYGFVRQSGGQVRIYSELGKGTTVCLYLPRHLGAEDSVETEERATAEVHAEGETVLVIDDEPSVRMLIIDVLEEQGYSVLEARDGPSAAHILSSNARLDLIVTDVGLPGGMNGRQIADLARISRPSLQVLFITGFAENSVIGNGHLDAGMEILTKPFTMSALAQKVRRMLDGA